MTVPKAAITPMMAQYLEIKAEYSDALLFYRMGDFYELFFDDAVSAAEALDITLTKRGKHLGDDIAMCGVPVHSAEGYLLALIRKGFRVAVCEQLEEPAEAKKRGSKSVVKRGVVRLVTPGTLTEESLLDARRHNYLASIAEVRGDAAIAWVDISTGEFRTISCSPTRFSPELARLQPSEVLVSESKQFDWEDIIIESGAAATGLEPACFDSQRGETALTRLFAVESLEGYGSFSRAELAAMGSIISYLDLTQKGRLPLLRPPIRETTSLTMQIDAATRRNLEINHALSGSREGSLIQAIDRTITAGGGRLMERRISSPSTKLDTVHERLAATTWFFEEPDLCADARSHLRRCSDIQRALSRLSIGRAGPRDLAAVRNTLEQLPLIKARLGTALPDVVKEWTRSFDHFAGLYEGLDRALVAEPSNLVRDGNFIASGFAQELDEARQLRDDGRSVIATYQREYAQETAISTLKIKHNNVLGYFIETTAAHAEKMLSPPHSDRFVHRQTTANAVRFTTIELSEIETKILSAGFRALELEKLIFDELVQVVLAKAGPLGEIAIALAEIDLAASFATLARSEGWCKPLVNESRSFAIKGGRHPVVERALKAGGGIPFIANDCCLTEREGASMWLLTGPNMAGKSTFLRQNALIALLAQAGSFVPAEEAQIGIVSQLFSRVGASDDLARGRSTFMVEMVETAAILNQADDRALVILDEIGRGTATYDGLSIAWATLEHLHDVNKCRALFATHYHEMTRLADRLPGVENATVAVKEWQGDVVFLHEVRKGAADRSYGVQVAKLAGLPASVVERARIVLQALEKGEREGGSRLKTVIDDLPLFSVALAAEPPKASVSAEIETILEAVLPDELTPREALETLYELKEVLRKSASS